MGRFVIFLAAVSEAIFARMLRGDFRAADARLVNAVVARVAAEQGADAVALACTELPMLFRETAIECALPALDTTQLLVDAVVAHVRGSCVVP